MPSSRVILSILNASASALLLQEQINNSSKYVECWMCFSASPPFYEGIALFGEFIYSNESNVLYGGSLGFTLTEVSGVGSCILGEHMLPPHQLLEICNHTLVVNKHHEYLLAPNHTYLACSSGLTTYVIISDFFFFFQFQWESLLFNRSTSPNLQLESHRYFHAVMNSDKANQRLHTAKRAKLLQLTSFHRQSINRCPLQCTMVLVTKEFKWDLERR